MASFVHLTDARLCRRIIKSGLHTEKRGPNLRGVFCVPVTPSYEHTHQWLRELKRRGYRSSCAVQFLVPDDEIVQIGVFGGIHREVRAAEAVAAFLEAEDPRGLEVIVRRSVMPRDLLHVRLAPKAVGWRFYPSAKGREPLWPRRGEIRSSRLRARVDQLARGPWE